MSLCSQLLELLPTETWESISNFVVNSRNMKSSDSKTPMRRQKQITEKVYLTWNLWGPGRDNSNYCLVIWSKKDMLPSPQRSPKVSSNHHRKKFLVCNRLPGLHSWPGTIKPLASRKGTKANHTSHIQGDLQVCGSRHARIMPGYNQNPTLCQEERNCCHHWRSRRNSWLIHPAGHCYWGSTAIKRRRKALPGQTTLAAWCKWPIRDSNSRFVNHRRGIQEWMSSLGASNLPSGRRATWLTKSCSIPKTVIEVAGPKLHLATFKYLESKILSLKCVKDIHKHFVKSLSLENRVELVWLLRL